MIVPFGKTPAEHQRQGGVGGCVGPLKVPITPSRFRVLPSPLSLFQMSFYFSDTAVLLFDFWSVHTPAGRLPAPARPHPSGCPSVRPCFPPGEKDAGQRTERWLCLSGGRSDGDGLGAGRAGPPPSVNAGALAAWLGGGQGRAVMAPRTPRPRAWRVLADPLLPR